MKKRKFKNSFKTLLIFTAILYSGFLAAEEKYTISNNLFTVYCRAEAFRPGEILIFEVAPNQGKKIASVSGILLETPIEFYNQNGIWYALFGIPLKINIGDRKVEITALDESGTEVTENFTILLRKRIFTVSHLTVDPYYLTYTEEQTARIKKEQEIMKAVWANVTQEKLWEGNFISPIESEITLDFPVKRVFQEEFRSYHTGIDLRAGVGSEVKAANSGKIVICGDFFFSGKFIVIDHGRRLYSFYAHLSEFKVKMSDLVKKGQIIALSGDTGRITGPHLHWTMKVNAVNVDPQSVLKLKIY
jgi:murein DD-endopeptidase MepM/ murein hydrolase activator NlpD